MGIVSLNREYDSLKHFLNVSRPVEIHKIQRQLRKSISVILKLLNVLIEPDSAELIKHRSYQYLVSNLKTSPKHSVLILAQIQGQLR